MSEFLQDFAERFSRLNAQTLSQLDALYHPQVQFRDPLHEINGLDNLHRYFEQLYSNVTQLAFEFSRYDQVAEGKGYLTWTMSYRHPRLASGRRIDVEGCSQIFWQDQLVYSHRDYFDAGALLYEHLPVMGRMIHWLKGRLA